ncbi:MAG: outer membrane beta-barrel protein [Oleispira antarctica]|uniref:Outer membrane protein OmpW n=1 Tax=Oleispira antarctica RB-8 TaxID=698738 RepID=R4YP31_OLEAN|nr:outer membrane beta-barrel protein [Oleispira antarctica]MBQ0793923.1 outer membrane beta-barrel protein [Oleispira antarctica]CCK76871.1 Outer membrane protein OmpW [Oleispira antarctica RB-8]
MKLVSTLLATSIAVLGSSQVMAYEAGDIMVKAGVINVAPKNDNVSITGVGKVEVKDDTQLGLTGTYMITPQVGIEVLAATPFKHTVELDGNKIGTTKHLPPTVSVQYYPMDSSSAIQPYVGAGLNMTFFFDEAGAVKGDALGPLGDSFGLSVSAGVNYDIDDKFMANLAVWYIDIDSELEGSNTALGKDYDVEIDPIVVMAGVGYKF